MTMTCIWEQKLTNERTNELEWMRILNFQRIFKISFSPFIFNGSHILYYEYIKKVFTSTTTTTTPKIQNRSIDWSMDWFSIQTVVSIFVVVVVVVVGGGGGGVGGVFKYVTLNKGNFHKKKKISLLAISNPW